MFKNLQELEERYKLHSETGDYYDHPTVSEAESKLYLDTNSTKQKDYKKYGLRCTIFPKDIAMIYGDDSPIFARTLLQTIREATGQRSGSAVFTHIFCKYTGLDEETVNNFIHESFSMVYKLTFAQVATILEERRRKEKDPFAIFDKEKKDPFELYMKTGDFYDDPERIEINSGLYSDMDSTTPKTVPTDNYRRRFIVYPKDIAIIYGTDSPLFARYYLMKARKMIGSPMHTFSYYNDFSACMGLDAEIVMNFLDQS